MNSERVVTAAVMIQEGRVLLVRRGPGSKLSGHWEFPGGKVEECESVENCLARELKEEMGIEAQVGALLCESRYEYEHGTFTIQAFRVPSWIGKIVLTVHDQLAWASADELLSFDLLPADIPIAQQVLKELSQCPK